MVKSPELTNRQLHRDPSSREWVWPFWPVVPLYPYGQRRTLRREIVKDTVWTFEQVQGIFYVIVPIRMTVVRMAQGGLLVYAPVAPTPECIRLMRELEAQHGPVQYIILPTVTGIEHKVFVGPFARRFPTAQVFVAPHQWSFPLNLPLSWLGLPPDRTQVLPLESSNAPFAGQFDYEILGPIELGLGPFVEVALFHRSTRTLMVTDSIVAVPEEPPLMLQQDPYPLLFHAKDSPFEIPIDTPANRRKGWQRIVLFAFYFRPQALAIATTGEMVRDALQAPDRSKKNYFGLYPFRWQPGWRQSFEALWGRGRLFVAPILQTLIFNREPQTVLDWAERVATWQFERIIPCHLEAPLAANPQTFRQAFTFLQQHPAESLLATGQYPLPEADLQVLRDLDAGLIRARLTPPAQEKV